MNNQTFALLLAATTIAGCASTFDGCILIANCSTFRPILAKINWVVVSVCV
jgi:hypothetical protein